MTKYRGVEIHRDEDGYYFSGFWGDNGSYQTLAEAKAEVDYEIIQDRQMDPSWPPEDTPSIDLMAHHGPWNS